MKGSKHKMEFKILAISIGAVYLWFGALKFFPHLSPAEDLAIKTIDILDFGLIPANVSIILLALWETGIGLLLVFNLLRRLALGVAIVHIVLTFTPLFFFPEQVFNNGPFNLTLLGQYIIKNIVILSILIFLFKDVNNKIFLKQTIGTPIVDTTRNRVVQYSWQAQRVDSSSLEIAHPVQKLKVNAESPF